MRSKYTVGPFSEHLRGRNTGSVDITTSQTTVASVTHNVVKNGDVLLVFASLESITPNISNHTTQIGIVKTAGTSTVSFMDNANNVSHKSHIETAGGTQSLAVSGTVTVTADGTLTLSCVGTASADTTTVAASEGQISSILLT